MFSFKSVFGEEEFTSIVLEHEKEFYDELTAFNNQLMADYLFLGVRKDSKVQVLVGICNNTRIEGTEYGLVGSPCEQVLTTGACVFTSDVCNIFPEDNALIELNAQAYLGAGIFNEHAEDIGILVAIYTNPQPEVHKFQYTFTLQAKLFAMRIQKDYLEIRTNHNMALLDEVSKISRTGAWEFYPDDDVLYWSPEVYHIHNLPVGQRVTKDKAMAFYTLDSHQRIKKAFTTLVKHNIPYDGEYQIVDSSGLAKWVRTSGKAEFDRQGKLKRYFGAFEDITDYKNTVSISEERARRIQNILNSINDAVISIDMHGTIKHCNDVAQKMFGYTYDELVSMPVEILMPEPYATNHKKYVKYYEETGKAKIIGVGRQLPAKRKDGSIFQMELSLSESSDLGEKRYVGVVRDISERIEAQDAIYNLAYTDPVTHLRNSQWFRKEFQDLMVRSATRNDYVHVLLLNMDNMAQFNTRLGFSNGNKALQVIAEKLLFIIGQDYDLYKYSGDSFIVLSKRTHSKKDVYRFDPGLIENALLNPRHYEVEIDNAKFSLSASLGSAIFNPAEQTLEALINVLEHAVKLAKKSAPFGLCHISADGIEEFDRYLAIKDKLKLAIQRDELSLALQPQVDRDGNLTSFEALVRWQSPDLGWVSPGHFIPIAEESHVICDIGEVVLNKTLLVLKEFKAKGIDASIAINISARQIVLPDFASSLLARVKKYDISPQMLVLELTETALVVDIQMVKQTMLELAKFGFRFSVDDFGTGYSSLAYLKELPITELKIDKFFVDDICEENSGKASQIVDAIIEMSKALGVTCVAEGVETSAQLAYLVERGCDRFQGYYFSKPHPVSHWQQTKLEEKVCFSQVVA